MWHWGEAPDGWGMVWMGVMMAIMWLPLIILLVWALRGVERSPRQESPLSLPSEPDAREIARRGYARGDIDRERYLQIIEDLEQTRG